MPMNILGMIGVTPPDQSAVHIIGGGIDKDFLKHFAQVHEKSGFDAVLVGYTSASAEGFQVAQYCAHNTEQLKFLVAHRPGFVAPTLAARTAATFDNLMDGRLWVHIITGGMDAEQRRDGDWVGHDDRYARTDEYLDVVRKVWTEEKPFDYEGKYYQFARAFSEVRCHQKPHIPLWFGGMSDPAIAAGSKHCDTYALFGEPRANVQEVMDRIRVAAKPHGRSPKFNLSFRPIIADTEDAAWDRAHKILADIQKSPSPRRSNEPEAETARRLIRMAESGELQDECVWTPIAGAAGGSANTTALVGTPDQVAETIAKYYDMGISGVLMRGFDPLVDAEDYGRELIPLIREKVQARDEKSLAA
ncbi:MAG: LLM class flavin-dependent oxidoreductase [Pseudomonadota bacterium]